MGFRDEARKALSNAKAEIDSNDVDRLRYAALSLRMALEALVYERAEAYKEDFPKTQYATWQPKKVLEALLDLDPAADRGASLSVSKEPAGSSNPVEYVPLGTEHVVSLRDIKKHYDALGSWLHTPTLAQLTSTKATDISRLRNRCDQVVEIVEQVLASSMWGLVIRPSSTVNCLRCGEKVRALLPLGAKEVYAKCYSCGAGYNVTKADEPDVIFDADQIDVTCPNKTCREKGKIWRDHFKIGSGWTCPGCAQEVVIALGLVHRPADSDGYQG